MTFGLDNDLNVTVEFKYETPCGEEDGTFHEAETYIDDDCFHIPLRDGVPYKNAYIIVTQGEHTYRYDLTFSEDGLYQIGDSQEVGINRENGFNFGVNVPSLSGVQFDPEDFSGTLTSGADSYDLS